MFTSWRILECPVLPQFGVHFIPYSRESEQPPQYPWELEGSGAELSPVVTTQAKIQFSISILHEISQHVIYVSKPHHHKKQRMCLIP